jgi:hypothetical protein
MARDVASDCATPHVVQTFHSCVMSGECHRRYVSRKHDPHKTFALPLTLVSRQRKTFHPKRYVLGGNVGKQAFQPANWWGKWKLVGDF